MSYLVQQMWLCLLLAAILGALIGWWLAKSSTQRKLDDIDASWQRKLDQQQNEHSQAQQQASKSVVAVTAATTAAAVTTAAVAEPEAVAPEAPTAVPEASLIEDQASYDVEEVEGIGPNYGKKLRDMGIHTTEQLLAQAYDMDGQIRIAEHIGIEDFVIRKWASMCDLMRLNGIAGQFSELMVYARIDSVQDLGQQNASTLHKALLSSNDTQNRIETIPDEASLELIINQAKSLKPIMRDD